MRVRFEEGTGAAQLYVVAVGGVAGGAYSARINDQYRICFRWLDEHAYDVEIVDYH